MSDLSAGDRFLIAEIRRGSADGWAQLIGRYQGRLVAFARSHLKSSTEWEDVVQETFLSFLQSLDRYREDASLETFLFMLLRRRIVDYLRQRGRGGLSVCSLQDTMAGTSDALPRIAELADQHVGASDAVMQREQRSVIRQTLHIALKHVVRGLQQQEKFRDLQILELIFYAQLRNKQIADLLAMDEKQVALRKHRLIERLAHSVDDAQRGTSDPLDDSMLTRAWEELRPSCPKRSTLGKFVLGALEGPWADYMRFHVDQLGCRFCQANLEDVQFESDPGHRDPALERILQSSIGFFRPETRGQR